MQRKSETRGAALVAFSLLSAAILVPGCLYDPDKPCGDELEFEAGTCVCPEGTIARADGGCEQLSVGDGDAVGGAGGAMDGNEPPLGARCKSDKACATIEDGYCDIIKGWCTKKDCSLENDECPGGWECCDLTAFGLELMCVSLAEGGCP